MQLGERFPELRALGLAVRPAPGTARIVYVENSFGPGRLEPGENLAGHPVRRDALQRAQRTAAAALSGIVLSRPAEGGPRARVGVYVPFFDRSLAQETPLAAEAISGWAFAEISVHAMMDQLFGEDLHASPGIGIRMRDGPSPTGDATLYAPASEPASRRGAHALETIRRIAAGGREWTIEVRALPSFTPGTDHDHGPLLAIAGVASSGLVSGLTWLLATGTARARRAATRMNRELIESEGRLRELNEDLEQRVARRTHELETYSERLALAVHTSNTGLWDWNLLTGQIHYSAEWASQLGLEARDLRPTFAEWESRLHPQERERVLARLHAGISMPGRPCEMELRMRHRDGSYRTILCRMQAHADASGKPVRAVGSHLDITERKRAEEATVRLAHELRQAWHKLSQVEEAERRWLAGELHDTIGSALTALSLNLTLVRERLPQEARTSLEPRINDSIGLVDETVETVRNLMAQLRPPVLDDYGLATAVSWYLDRIAARAGLARSFRLVGDDARLDAEKEIALFRIAQGALTNAVRHAAARRVDATVEVTKDTVRMTIEDDGRGFVTAHAHDDPGSPHWGLVTMRERAESIGGRCVIESAPGHGTRVLVEAPR